MLVSGREGINIEDMVLQESEQIIKDMFVKGEYQTFANKNHVNPNDVRKILPMVINLLNKQLISFTIALIMKPENGKRDVYIGQDGPGKCYKINSNEVTRLEPEVKEKKEISVERLKKEDAFLVCSCEVAESLENKLLQQALGVFREPEELCKKIIFTSYNKVGIGNFSAAVFIERDKPMRGWKRNYLKRGLIFTAILLILAAAWIVINNSVFKPKVPDFDKMKEGSALKVTPPIIINQAPHKVIVSDIPHKTEQNPRTIREKKTVNNKNVAFMLNGSVIMITNWSSVGKEIKYISWTSNQRNKNRIYKYPDYTRIPGSISVTFKDHTTRVFNVK